MATNNATNTPQLTLNGQLIIGSTGVVPVAATLTAGSGISIVNGAGTITIASTGSAPWVDQTTTPVTMTVNTAYIVDNAGLVTLTIPATAAIGDSFTIVGKGAGGWLIQANAGQTVNLGTSASSVAGTLASTNRWDAMEITCVTANTTFACRSVQGSITVA